MTRRSPHAGFTLLEVMVSIAIVGLMMLVGWGTLNQTIRARKEYGRSQERYREVRVAMNRIALDVGMTYLSVHEPLGTTEKRTFFVGENGSDFDSLRFSAFAHTPLYAHANESDQTVIAYYPKEDPEDRSRTNLMRRESRRLAPERWDSIPGESDVLFSGLTKFEITYWDAKAQEWKDEWNTMGNEGMGRPRPPDRVRWTIGLLDERGKEITLTSEARVHLQEQVELDAL